ncbi:hypothetical protein [Pseudobutyrivibrio ruminis]|uniref:Uncharacterized protein n=2 Tax=root TaxID=1 RepID=A0A2G3DSX5_9FIRM|nr:hypothetical protein [Pseudobutyrivibrio ruminis]AAA26399.1 putative replication protein [Plasmid pRJF1]ABD13965.1 putative replication protein [Shuttle vector pBK638]ABI26291.1 ORF1 [Promoter reporter vector pBKGT]ABI26294.1 ORF1 [Promoter rescue vector pBK]PHU34084.1 hypothetical protein CSX01_11920 [Pseudobutyrivibrio ruminis]
MTITEFAESRQVQPQAISRYIGRHPEKFNGHTEKKGKTVELDDIALELLEKKYPMPAPVQIIEDTESRQKLIKAQELIIQLQDKLMDAQSQIAEAEATKILLEDKNAQIEKYELTEANYKKQIDELLEELSKEKSKTWIDKLFKK